MTEPAAETAQLLMRNVAELAQRQQARERGSALASQIFRLLKVAQFHALDNMAFLQQLDQTVEALKAFGAQTGEPLTLLFAKSTVFVCGQLLKASRTEYESALELSELVRRLGVTQLTIQTDADRADLSAMARLFQPPHKARAEHGVIEPSPRVRLRFVSAARLDENDQEMSPEDQILRTYATTVVVMRRVYENLQAARYQLPNQVKRLAQRLVVLSEGDTPAFLGVTGMRSAVNDAAGRSVSRAILAVAMGRQLTQDLATLSRIAMSALFMDVAIPLVSGSTGKGAVATRMTPTAEQRLPAATAAVLTALGQVRDASMVRTVIAYEAHWLRQATRLGPMYDGEYKPMVAARIVATAHRFNELMQPDLASNQSPSVDDAIATLRGEARDTVDQAMLVLLVGALGVFPRGSPVQLSTGESAVVLRSPDNPADYPRPTVRLVYDAAGKPLRMKVALDLAADDQRQVVRVIAQPDATLLQACQAVLTAGAPEPPRPEVPVSARAAPVQSPSIADVETETVRPRAPSVPDFAAPRERIPSSHDIPPPSQRRLPSVQELTPAPQLRLSSEPELTPPPRERAPSVAELTPTPASTVKMRRSRASLVEVVEAPRSRRDPRSEDFDEEEAPAQAPAPAPSPPPRQRKLSQQLTRRPSEVLETEGLPELIPDDTDELVVAEPSDPSSHWRRAPATLEPLGEPVDEPGPETHAPSASGSLERTPFSNVFLYVLDRALSGTLVLSEPVEHEGDDPAEHAVLFQDGIPTKVHVNARVAALGPLLVAFGAIEQEQLQNDPITQPPTHEATLEQELLASGLCSAEQITEVRNEQIIERLAFLFGLPPATRYAFYNGFDLVQVLWGDVPGVTSPLGALSRGLREHPEESAMDAMLLKLAALPLALHPEADPSVFDFTDDELAVANALAGTGVSVPDLIEAGHHPDVVRRVVYELMLTHCLAPVSSE
ncbi:MAG: hypothetical protein IT375_29375 [Polyangiaceae bacterium]|nr:hypothetical protein [Polyangiaceae bacterium]